MVPGFLIAFLVMLVIPAWGGQKSLQLCLSCHTAHYADRGHCRDCHRGNPASARKNIAHAGLREGKYAHFTIDNAIQKREGEHLVDQLACRRCHVSAGRGNRLAMNLDVAAGRKSAGELAFSLRRPVVNMPNFRLDEERTISLVNSILAGSQGRKTDDSAPVRIHFSHMGEKSADIFSKKCGSCHRLLSERFGAVGTADVGPNLSGLFTQYYPKTFKADDVWTAKNLSLWIINPRKTRPLANMQPVILTEAEIKELVTVVHTFSQ